MSTYTLKDGSTYQITTRGTTTSTLASLGGTSEPFAKAFHSYIIVEAQDNGISKFKGDLQTQQELVVSGSILVNNHLTISGSTTISSTNQNSVILVTTTGSAVTLTIPTTTNATRGKIFFIKKIGGTNTLTIDSVNPSTIDGALTRSTTDASASIQLMSSGNTATGYYIISQYGTWT